MNSSRYPSDLTNSQWLMIGELLPARKQRGRRRRISLRAVMNAIFYLLRTGCQWRQLPSEFPAWRTVYWYFRSWQRTGVWVRLQRALYRRVRVKAGRAECPSVVIMDGQSVKTTEIGGIRGFDAQAGERPQAAHPC
ncbi:IS5 family transposase [Phyllobacterium sp. LjRoot231]|uniref:IS5 family transposase n=1 Tax=Phyllobacterium sp. LjRoot231 TaxID=3342289 RepID=UPI003ECE1992